MNKVNKMVRDLINVSARLADEKDYDNKIAPTLQGIINYLKKLKKKEKASKKALRSYNKLRDTKLLQKKTH